MKRWERIIVAGVGLVWLLAGCSEKKSEKAQAPPVEHRTIDVADVIDYASLSANTLRVRTTRDVIPGGLSAAMAPAFVVWDRSDFSPGGTITVRNVNHGGNPVAGVTVLRTAVIDPGRVLRAEYILVPLGGPEAISHGQLRFVFAPGAATLLGDECSTVGAADSLTDLVLSWEAWRPPGVDYNILKGMDPSSYELSMRAYSGVQRFLEDALQNRDWKVYTLDLPGGQAGAIQLLQVALAMGDGAARYVVSQQIERAPDDWVSTGPPGKGEDVAALWQQIAASLGGAHTGGDERLDMAGHSSYQSVLRSCATMAQYCIDVATARLIEQGYPSGGKHPSSTVGITDTPEWMKELSQASIAGLFVRGPKMLEFAHKDPGAIPGNVPGQLDKAGLVVEEDGKAVRREFNVSGETPWGPANRLLIR